MKLCSWVNLNCKEYIDYHNFEWGVPSFDDDYLFEMLILESFQAGLNWETILKKRKYFKIAYDDFNVKKVSLYNDLKIKELMSNKNIIHTSF